MGQEIGKHQPKVSANCEENTVSPKDLYGTSQQTGFNREMDGMTHLFENLAALSPHHNFIDKATFIHYFPLGGILADRLFAAFDQDKNGVIDVKEFLGGLALCLNGSLDDKYRVVFDMFNLDGSDGVSAYELQLVLKSMVPAAAKILRARESGECYSSSAAELDLLVSKIVQDAFEQCDSGKSGKLRWTEFKRWMARHPFILDSVFNHASMMDKQFQYSRLKERQKSNSRDGSRPPAGISELRSQTWVSDEASHHHKPAEENAQSFTGSYVGAEHLWSPVFAVNTALPCARSKHAACLFDGAVFVLGGRSTSGSLKDFWRFDPGSNMWSHVVAGGETRPPSLQEHTVVARKRKFYIFGGEFTSSAETPLWIFDLDELLWNKQRSNTKGPVNRRSHTAVWFEDAMFIFGGFIDLRSATSELWKYEFDTCCWARLKWQSNDGPSPRYCHSAVVHDRAMWVFGGLEGLQAKSDLWRLSLDFYRWSRIRARGGPPGLFGHSATVVGDGMLIFGGETSDGSLMNTLWRFDFESRSWSTIRPRGRISPPVRSGHTMLALPASAFLLSARPTTSRSDPPPTPRPDAPFKGGERPSSSPSITGEVNYVMHEGTRSNHCTPKTLHSEVSYIKSIGSLGSLDSVEVLREARCNSSLQRQKSSSMDSIISSVERSEPAVRSASPLVKVSYDLVDVGHPARTAAEVRSAGDTPSHQTQMLANTRGQSLLVQMYKPRRTGAESTFPPPFGEGRGEQRSWNNVVSNSAQTMERGVMCLLVLGGKLKNSVDMYGRTLDTWKCVIDPVKSKGERVSTIVVERNQESHSRKNPSNPPHRLLHLPPDGQETDTEQLGFSECILSDVVDGDTCSVDLLLADDGCAYPSAYYGDLQHRSDVGPATVSI